jgi:hypothetical protein
MSAHLARAAAIATLLTTGMLAAPNAVADTNPSVPGDPTGQIYTPPGYIGYYPGVYGLQTIFSLTPPRRILDSGGVGAMTNADPASSYAGLPGDRLGVQKQHVVVKPQEAGPSGQVFGVRTGSPMQATSAPDAAGGVMPGATSAIGRQNLATGQATGLENPSPSGQAPKQPLPPRFGTPSLHGQNCAFADLTSAAPWRQMASRCLRCLPQGHTVARTCGIVCGSLWTTTAPTWSPLAGETPRGSRTSAITPMCDCALGVAGSTGSSHAVRRHPPRPEPHHGHARPLCHGTTAALGPRPSPAKHSPD